MICKFQTPSLPFPRLIKTLNELLSRLRLSLDEDDFGESTSINLNQIVKEGGIEESAKLKNAFKVNSFRLI